MARHPTARRVKHAQPDPDDAFLAQLLELTAWARTHSRILTTVGFVLVIGLAAGLYYRNFQQTVRARAETELAAVRQTVASGNAQLAIRDLEEFISRSDGTRAADEARLLLAQTHLESDQPQQAIAAVQPLAAELGEGMGTSAAILLASAYEENDQLDEAETLYLRIADRAQYDFQRQEALDSAARIRMAQGQHDGAAELYARLVDMMPEGTPERGIFELRLAEARAAAQTPGAS